MNNIITIINNNKKKKIIYNKKNTILNILKKKNIYISYQCLQGYCGICRITLIQGKIKYLKKNILVILNPKEILTCCCIPINNISIKI